MRWRPSNLVPRRRWRRVLVATLLLLVLAYVAVPQLFVPMIRSKLEGMIGSHLDAKLHIGRLMYSPPFGVRARDVRVVSGASLPGWNGDVELLRVAKLDLKLAHLPFRRGPLVIQNITVTEPEVHLVGTEDGRLVGMHRFVRRDSPTGQALTAPQTQPEKGADAPLDPALEAARAKLSDMFELRHFGIRGGRVVFEDRSRPGLPPVVWKDLNVGMETVPKSKGVYGYAMEASNGDLAALRSTGSFDLDALSADVGNLHIDVRTAYTQEQSPLPAQVQQVLRDYRVEGRVTLDADGRFDLRDPWASAYRATIDLKEASGYVPRWDVALDRLAVRVTVDNRLPLAQPDPAPPARPLAGPVRVSLEGLEATSGDARFELDKAEALLDHDAGTWSLAQVAGRLDLGRAGATRPIVAGMSASGRLEFTVAAGGPLRRRGVGDEPFLAPEDLAFLIYPRDLTILPRKSPAPMERIGGGGSVRKDRGSRVVVFQNLTFAYGGDPIELTSARLPLPRKLADLKKQTRLEEISGTIDFHRPGPRYPGKFGRVVDKLRPVGPFVIGRDSWYSVSAVEPDLRIRTDPASPPSLPRSRKSDYFFSVSTDSASFTLTEKRLELTNMSGDATISNMLVDVRRLEADMLGGRLTTALKVTPGALVKYQGKAYVRGLDLSALSRLLILPETRNSRLSGVGNMNVEFVGAKPRDKGDSLLSTVRAAGELEILRGNFWTIPVLGEIGSRVRGTRDHESLGTVGEAAGFFELADGTLTLRDAAVSSPALGVAGSGTIALEGEKRLDLRIIAAPLGDWKDKLKQTNVPLLSDVVGEVAGAAQQALRAATSALLYEFRVTGTAGHPDVATVPVPALTDAAVGLFDTMARGSPDKRLLESMKSGQPHQKRQGEPR